MEPKKDTDPEKEIERQKQEWVDNNHPAYYLQDYRAEIPFDELE